MKAIEQYFHVVVFVMLYKVVLLFRFIALFYCIHVCELYVEHLQIGYFFKKTNQFVIDIK